MYIGVKDNVGSFCNRNIGEEVIDIKTSHITIGEVKGLNVFSKGERVWESVRVFG
jgi:hypothetical protein